MLLLRATVEEKERISPSLHGGNEEMRISGGSPVLSRQGCRGQERGCCLHSACLGFSGVDGVGLDPQTPLGNGASSFQLAELLMGTELGPQGRQGC